MPRNLNHSILLPQERIDQFAIGIIGTGAIGSFVAMALAKMGFNQMMTWDFDKIEDHNIANQMFPVEAVGKRKSTATQEMVKQFSGEDIVCTSTAADGKKVGDALMKAFPGKVYIVILAVDSLDVRRKLVWELKGYPVTVIDARMGAKTYRVMGFWAARQDEFEAYMKTLVPDAQAVQDRCGAKSIIYTVLGVAAEVCNFVHTLVMAETSPFITNPVVFDYGTGLRLQKPLVAETVVI